MHKHIFINSFAVNANKIQRDVVDGREVVILKDTLALRTNSVMNGLFYPESLVKNSYHELNDVLAPVGHPAKPSGELLPSTDWMAINEFHGGAKNTNARITDNGEVLVDIVIDTKFASNTEKGKALLERVEKIESGEEANLWTSTGLYYSANNEAGEFNGKSYKQAITSMKFEHNALLLNELPAGGDTGFTVNSEQVEVVDVSSAYDMRKPSKIKQLMKAVGFKANELSYDEIKSSIDAKMLELYGNDDLYGKPHIYNTYFVYEKDGKLYKRDYSIESDGIKLSDPIHVDSKFTEATTNAETPNVDETQIKEMIANALEAQQSENKTIMDAQAAKIAELEATIAANADKELSTKREAVKTKFGLTDEAVKDMGVNALDAMYAQTISAAPVAAGVDFSVNSDDALFVDFNAQLDAVEAK